MNFRTIIPCMTCNNCNINKAIILRSKNHCKVCKSCFFTLFEEDVHDTITSSKMFPSGSTVGVCISGGKDSTVLAYILNKLNDKYKYNLQLVLLCIDEGIKGYRDHSIDTVLQNKKDLNLDLKIISFKDLFGINMDEVSQRISKKNSCTYCGVFRRQAIEEAARNCKVDYIATGHNADDVAETVLLNFIRGDVKRLIRCTSCVTTKQSSKYNYTLSLPRAKPFKYTYQKEIVLYAFHKKLKYFSTECTYAPEASRGYVRNFVKELEKMDRAIIYNIIKNGDLIAEQNKTLLKSEEATPCKNCSHSTSSKDNVCKACTLAKSFNKLPM